MNLFRRIPLFLLNSLHRSVKLVGFADVLQLASILAKLLVVKLNLFHKSADEKVTPTPLTPLVLVHT